MNPDELFIEYAQNFWCDDCQSVHFVFNHNTSLATRTFHSESGRVQEVAENRTEGTTRTLKTDFWLYWPDNWEPESWMEPQVVVGHPAGDGYCQRIVLEIPT